MVQVVDTVRAAHYMQNLIGKVSAWCLVSVQTNALKAFELEESPSGTCSCVVPIWCAIPCRHQLYDYVHPEYSTISLSMINISLQKKV